ncbi:MAG TPA: DUF2971 domain-containing protein [Bacteroidia bacterium]|nr:DUF2971 domain-containing protein [Bacteroidia bacterium]
MNWKEDYFAKLGSAHIDLEQIDNAQRIKLNHMPSNLYKYRQVNEFSLKNLENDTVYLNSPSEYNDPFEFVEAIDFVKINNMIEKKYQDELVAKLLKHYPVPEKILYEAKDSDSPLAIISEYQLERYQGFTKEQAEKTTKILNEMMQKSMIDAGEKKLAYMQSQMKVCSFCESPNQLLMWGHYADCHKGFCIEYNISKWSKDDVRNRLLSPVVYLNSLYDATEHLINQINGEGFNNIYPFISGAIKSKEWEYEKEWRLIFPIGPSFPRQDYPMGCQSKVILGARMTENNKQRITSMCFEKGIKVMQAKPSTTEYKLDFASVIP